MNERERFYIERDRRSRQYGIEDDIFYEQPVAVAVGPDAIEFERGQLTLLALINMLVRFHRHLCLSIPDGRLLAPRAIIGNIKLKGHEDLKETIDILAHTINPFIRLDWTIPPSIRAGVGIGKQIKEKMPWYIGTQAGIVTIEKYALEIDKKEGFSLGGCFAACIAASIILKQVLGKPVVPSRLSAWNLKEAESAEPGPEILAPLNVGKVLMVGAGGVGSCVAYWLRQWSMVHRWTIVDGDKAELRNTKRSLGIVPKDTGWPNSKKSYKAMVAADIIGATACNKWYDQLDQDSLLVDIILPLANERGVRNMISQRGEPLILHATTSHEWEAQLHRHIAGRDDCIMCRIPPSSKKVQLECSTVSLGSKANNDAALPFLSATAGLLLVTGLYRLMYGQLEKDKHNWWRVIYKSGYQMMTSARCKCRIDCPGIPIAAIRYHSSKKRRWSTFNKDFCISHTEI